MLEVELTDDNALACLARVERALVEEPEGADGHVPPFDLAAAVQGWRSIPDGVPEVFQPGSGGCSAGSTTRRRLVTGSSRP